MSDNLNCFDSIAVCLPGGGYRAAGFSLGILKMLHDCGLGKNIKGISTVSGGTITGAKYAQMLADGKPDKDCFEDFYGALYNWLSEDKLVTNAMSCLKKESNFTFKKPNLINAFALQYREFIPGIFGDIDKKLKARNNNEGGLKNIIFNATDFENGLQFRFRNDGGVCGNGLARIPKQYINRTRLGDIVAASSCFPGGFEPIIYPNDFMKETGDLAPIALMDGGIIDNQGSSSLLTNDQDYSCILIGDAGSYRIKGFEATKESWKTRIISLFFNIWFTFFLVLLTFFLFCKECYFLFALSCFVASISIVLQVLVQVGLLWAKKTSDSTIPFKLPRNKVGIYLLDRVNSLLLMNSSIFLKSAKSKNITRIYKEDYQSVSKLSIYELVLNPKTGRPHRAVEKQWERTIQILNGVPDYIQISSDISTNFATTLWFDKYAKENKILDHLVLTGRAVCCFNLVNHMVKNSENNREIMSTPLMKKLVKLWGELKSVEMSKNKDCYPLSDDFKVIGEYA